MTTTNISLHITGMSCGHCEKAVSNTIKNIEGVTGVTIDLPSGTALISYDPTFVSSGKIIAAINNMGTYQAHA